MNIKKILFTVSAVSVLALTSCGGSGITHERSITLKAYHADLNHDGQLSPEEQNLTWIEAYDTLIKEANSMPDLEEIADNLKISKKEFKRTSLARYEILHQAEELLMSTGAVMPVYNYGDPYMLKDNIGGIYTMNLGYKFFDQLEYVDGTSKKDFYISVGTKAESFDPAVNSDVSTTLAMNQFMVGAKRYIKGEEEEGYEKRGNAKIYKAELADGICSFNKKLVTSDESKVTADPEHYILFTDCKDLTSAGETPSDYEGTARYTLTIKDNAYWGNDEGKKYKITADDFIYAWTRASSGIYNGQGFGVWCNMFDMIRGYNAWNKIGQQTTNIPSEWSEKTQAKWNKLEPVEQAQYMQVYNGYENIAGLGCAGGMAGIIKNSDYQFTVQLINDCDYFEEMLAALMYMPVPKKQIIIVPSGETEQTAICSENGSWWMNENHEYYTSGPLCVNGKIDNVDSGGIKLKKSTSFALEGDECKVDNLYFKFIDKDSTIYDAYKSGAVQLINQFPSIVIDDASKTKDWCVADQIGLFFYDFNVNDNTFDIRRGMSEEDRQNLRWTANLLVNRDDIAPNVAKKGCTAANGFVSTGIIETCVPKWEPDEIDPKTGQATGAYFAIKEGDEYVTADWHNRNANQYEYLNDDPSCDYNEHIMSNRNNHPEGFIEIASEARSEEQVMRDNATKAIEFAKKAGVHYDEKTGKFTNFPRITISTNNGSGLEDIAERMQYYYSQWGIDVSIQTQEWQSFTATRRAGQFACARQGWVADYNDPRTYLDLCVSDSGNNDTQLGKDSWHSSH